MGRPSSSRLDLTQGSTFRNVVLFSTPIIVQGSFQVVYQLINGFWVGHRSKEALAGVTEGFPVIFLMISLVIGVAMGAGIMIAQYVGADRKDMVNLTSRNFLVIGSILVIGVSALMLLITDPILRMLEAPQEAFEHARIYLIWTFATLIVMFGVNAVAGIFRGLGDSRTPTTVIVWITLLNAILDPILIFGTEPIPGIPISGRICEAVEGLIGPVPALGVAGAAIGTALSNLVGMIVILILLGKMREYVSLSPRGFRFNWVVIRDILRLGIPASATMVIVSLASMVFIRLVNNYGTSAAAAYGIGIRLEALIMMPAQSIGIALSTIAGQNIGAGRKERIYKSLRDSQLISGMVGVIVAGVLLMIPGPITRAFQPKPEDYEAVLPFITLYVHIISLRYIAISLYFPIIGTIRGAGDVMASLVITGTTQLVITIPAAILLSAYMGFAGVLWALTLSMIVALAIAYGYYRTRRWESKAIITSGRNPA